MPFKILPDGPMEPNFLLTECKDLFEYLGKEFPQKEERMYDFKRIWI